MPDEFNKDDWLLDINKTPVEAAFLDAEFPKQVEAEWLMGDEPSDIDRDYYDIVWTSNHPKHPEVRMNPGLFIAFMTKDRYEQAFGEIGEPPDPDASIRAKLTVEKRDAPADKKSHPKWKCWLEVTAATFLSWELDKEADGIRGSMRPGLGRGDIAQRTSWFRPVSRNRSWSYTSGPTGRRKTRGKNRVHSSFLIWDFSRSSVRILSFGENGPFLARSDEKPAQRCPKCGHEF